MTLCYYGVYQITHEFSEGEFEMIVLRLAVFFMALAVFAGVLILVVLTVPVGVSNAIGIIGAVVIGTVISIPVAYVVANKMSSGMQI